jgi:phenylacetate-CoA ligase
MGLRETVEVVRRARGEVRAETRNRKEIDLYHRRRVRELIAHAAASSPFHRGRLGGAIPAPGLVLDRLPVMEKHDLVNRFDTVVTDRRLTLETLPQHVSEMRGPDPLLFGEYRVLTTGGTSGQTTYVPFDRSSWLSVRAAYVRLGSTHGFPPRLAPRRRIAQLTAGGPLHMTNRIAASHQSTAYVTLRLNVTSPISELGAALDEFRPDVISGYPSIIAALAEEQQAGRLAIAPSWIFCGSEQLTPRARAVIRTTWTDPYNIYATTESGGILAFECPAHDGLHIREEQCTLEAVDERNRPVADGQRAAGLLLTSWLNTTVPLIRYRLNDAAVITSERCRCGRSSRRILQLAGRQEDPITLPGQHGPVLAHPNHFEETIEERSEVAQYQVIHRPNQITISIVPRGEGGDWTGELATALHTRLSALGADPPPINIDLVDELSRANSPTGKLKVIISDSHP